LREHIMDIEKDKWLGYKKPYISKTLNEVLLLPEEQPSLKHVEGTVKDLPTLRQIEKVIEELPILKQIETDIKDLKDLKKLIEDLTINK
ncbi:14632_t:CDS:1, partial [Dentiscutata heterogama]